MAHPLPQHRALITPAAAKFALRSQFAFAPAPAPAPERPERPFALPATGAQKAVCTQCRSGTGGAVCAKSRAAPPFSTARPPSLLFAVQRFRAGPHLTPPRKLQLCVTACVIDAPCTTTRNANCACAYCAGAYFSGAHCVRAHCVYIRITPAEFVSSPLAVFSLPRSSATTNAHTHNLVKRPHKYSPHSIPSHIFTFFV